MSSLYIEVFSSDTFTDILTLLCGLHVLSVESWCTDFYRLSRRYGVGALEWRAINGVHGSRPPRFEQSAVVYAVALLEKKIAIRMLKYNSNFLLNRTRHGVVGVMCRSCPFTYICVKVGDVYIFKYQVQPSQSHKPVMWFANSTVLNSDLNG